MEQTWMYAKRPQPKQAAQNTCCGTFVTATGFPVIWLLDDHDWDISDVCELHAKW